MRVTAGRYKGRKLKIPDSLEIRPTADMVKQALFNKLTYMLGGARVLDLFSGSGALGIEAISRGAREVIFADKDPKSVALTKANLTALGINAKVYTLPYEKTLERLSGQKFDLILMDPPYKSGAYEPALSLIKRFDMLATDGIIVCEHNKDDKINSTEFELFDERSYGIKMLSFYKHPSL